MQSFAVVKLVLPAMDRLEMNHLLVDLEHVEQRYDELEQIIAERCRNNEAATILTSMTGVGRFTALALACRVGRIERFPRARSLANYWGLTLSFIRKSHSF